MEPFTRVEEVANYYLKAIQAVQHQSPYFLSGHSFGALVAFEMAQQLRKQGKNTALLAILDMPVLLPDREPIELDWDETQWIVAITQTLEALSGKKLGLGLEDFQPLKEDAQIALLKKGLEKAGMLPPGSGIKYIRSIINVIKADELAFLNYIPSAGYPDKITLFKTEKGYSDELWIYSEMFWTSLHGDGSVYPPSLSKLLRCKAIIRQY